MWMILSENINDPPLKAIVRYRNHPSIVAIKKFCNSKSYFSFKNVPSKHSSSWRRLEDVLKTSFVFVFRRRLDQDEYVRLSLTSSEDVLKTSWSRPIYLSWPYVFKTSSRRFQDLFKTSSRRFEDVFKMSSRHLQEVLQRYLQDVFKAYHQANLFYLTCPREVFNTFLSTEEFA